MRRNRTRSAARRAPLLPPGAWPSILAGLAALAVAAVGGRSNVAVVASCGLAALGLGLAVGAARERSRWLGPVRVLARGLSAFNDDPDEQWDLPGSPPLADLVAPVRDLQARFLALKGRADAARDDTPAGSGSGEMGIIGPLDARMTRSGTFDPPGLDDPTMGSGEFATNEMINRLDPSTLRWLESSPAEQAFLGWSLEELKGKSFLDIVQVDDRRLAKQELRTVLGRGEGHALIYRIATARGETRSVELNVGVRYGADRRVLHLRCHLADVTAKLLDEGELRRRTLELTQANDDLRRANRELQKLKDRYSDLYENAPAMYFAVDRRGRILQCNDTLVHALGYSRAELIGRALSGLEPEARRSPAADRFPSDLRPGPIEHEAEWARSDGGVMAVWVTGTAIPGADGRIRQVRCVAQDVTARRRLEAELRDKNARLALANAELSGKNRELDEFTHVVSHDIQEPIRTLIAFSEFLMREQGDRLDDQGREHVRYLVEASKRLRSLIRDLLSLSRAGRVTAEFAAVDLDEVVERVRADLAGLARSKRGEIVARAPLPTLWGDRDRIGQLLANLVANGLKYNQAADPRVEVSATADGTTRSVTLSVRDNGIGIDPRFHGKIFGLFRRLHARDEYEGTGAGLAICQKIVHAHGGQIRVESEPGRGSTFHVTLPGAPEDDPTEKPDPARAP